MSGYSEIAPKNKQFPWKNYRFFAQLTAKAISLSFSCALTSPPDNFKVCIHQFIHVYISILTSFVLKLL